jgi:hypothetical protein
MSGGRPEFVVLATAQEGRPVPVAFPNDTLIVTDGRNTLGASLDTSPGTSPAGK